MVRVLFFAKEFEYNLFLLHLARSGVMTNILIGNRYSAIRVKKKSNALYIICALINDSDIAYLLDLNDALRDLCEKFNDRVYASLIGTAGAIMNVELYEWVNVVQAVKFDRGLLRMCQAQWRPSKATEDVTAQAVMFLPRSDKLLESPIASTVRFNDAIKSAWAYSSNMVNEAGAVALLSEANLCKGNTDHRGYDVCVADMETFDFVEICKRNGVVIDFVLRVCSDLAQHGSIEERLKVRFDNLPSEATSNLARNSAEEVELLFDTFEKSRNLETRQFTQRTDYTAVRDCFLRTLTYLQEDGNPKKKPYVDAAEADNLKFEYVRHNYWRRKRHELFVGTKFLGAIDELQRIADEEAEHFRAEDWEDFDYPQRQDEEYEEDSHWRNAKEATLKKWRARLVGISDQKSSSSLAANDNKDNVGDVVPGDDNKDNVGDDNNKTDNGDGHDGDNDDNDGGGNKNSNSNDEDKK